MTRPIHPDVSACRSRRAGLVAAGMLTGCLIIMGPAAAQAPTPPAAQPTLPAPIKSPSSKAQPSPVVDSIAGGGKSTAEPEAKPRRTAGRERRRVVRHHRYHMPVDIDRPALAGVLLVEPVPPPFVVPRPIVPTPAYFVDSLVSAFTIAPPPLVCRPTPRDLDLPDPRLYREVPLACAPDIE